MPRLVTFGCSYVYGHGLPDCHKEDNKPGVEPSKFAWPTLLADKLNYQCLNLSAPGSGNLEIFMKILNTEFLPDDLVIVAWSFFNRYDHYRIVDLHGNGMRLPFSENVNESIEAKLLKINENYIEKNYWDNWLTIQNCELFLNSKNIKNFNYLGFNPKIAKKDTIKPKVINLQNLLDISLVRIDNALDGSHPGIKSHRLQADRIYSKIKEYELRRRNTR